jgi:hypothetical protein
MSNSSSGVDGVCGFRRETVISGPESHGGPSRSEAFWQTGAVGQPAGSIRSSQKSVYPPSTTTTSPVMNEEASEAR